MAKRIERRIPLAEPGDFMDVRLFVEKGEVVGFVVNYTATIRGQERVVCRYDTCHGHLHVHRYWLDRPDARDLEDPTRPAASYKERAARAQADLRENFRAYRTRMELKG